MQVPARFCSVLPGAVTCGLCPHRCTIAPGRAGNCGVRHNRDGKAVSSIYAEVTSASMDPIEKKPLYHFYPAHPIFSVGTMGCNLHCSFCQNYSISQNFHVRSDVCLPDSLVKAALDEKSIGIAYTYSEPIIWYEYVFDTALCARAANLKNVLVTNGYINREPFLELLPLIDAANIDLKFFSDEHYRRYSGASLAPVLDSIELAHKHTHIELTTLVVTGINDTIETMRDIIRWIAALDKNIPWHISRYHPAYKYSAPPTDIGFLEKVYQEARSVLPFVYVGNIAHESGLSNTACPSCGMLLIERSGYATHVRALKNGRCTHCKKEINGIGSCFEK